MVGFIVSTLVAVVAASCSSGVATTPSGGSDPITQLAASAPEAQRAFLEDGVVTAAEREQAFFAWTDCMEAQGVRLVSYTLKPRGGETLELDTTLDADAQDRVEKDCRAEFYGTVSEVYARQNAPSASEEAAWLKVAADCLREAGYDNVPDGATFPELMEIDPEVAGECYNAARSG